MLRVLPLGCADGATQMATDAALLEGLALGLSPPTFRLYRWAEPTLSLGFHQKVPTGIDPGLAVVRRPSGGRAVLHSGDLTYALVVPRPPGAVLQGYAHLCRFLIAGFARLGIDLEFGTPGRGYIGNPSCFGTATGADLLHGGRKLIGSAQVRRQTAVLQHGSILLAPDRRALAALFGPATGEAVVGLGEIRTGIADADVLHALTAALEETLGLSAVQGPLSAWEHERIVQGRGAFRVG